MVENCLPACLLALRCWWQCYIAFVVIARRPIEKFMSVANRAPPPQHTTQQHRIRKRMGYSLRHQHTTAYAQQQQQRTHIWCPYLYVWLFFGVCVCVCVCEGVVVVVGRSTKLQPTMIFDCDAAKWLVYRICRHVHHLSFGNFGCLVCEGYCCIRQSSSPIHGNTQYRKMEGTYACVFKYTRAPHNGHRSVLTPSVVVVVVGGWCICLYVQRARVYVADRGSVSLVPFLPTPPRSDIPPKTLPRT